MRTFVISCLGLILTLATVFAENKYDDHGVVVTGLQKSDEGFRHLITFGDLDNFGRNEIASFTTGDPQQSYISCDVSYSRNELYLYDYTNQAIALYGNFNTSMIPEAMELSFVHVGIAEEYPKIAVDWISNNLYFVDTLMSWIAVQPLGPDVGPDDYRVLIDKDVSLIRALCVDPVEGLMFWADFWDDKLESATIKGEKRDTLLTDLNNPLDIVAHPESKRVFFTNGYSIETVGYDGKQRISLVRKSGAIFFDIAIFQGTILASDINDDTIKFFYLNGTTKYAKYGSVTELLFGVCLYHSEMQPQERDRCKTMGCSDMCVDEKSGASCMCKDGWKLESNGKTCIEDEGKFYRAIVIATLHKLCLLDVRILGKFHDLYTTPYCFYEDNTTEISNMDLNMGAREIYFSAGTDIFSIPVRGTKDQRRLITQQSRNITGLTYDWVDGILYYAMKKQDDSSFESIWSIELGGGVSLEHKNITAGTVRGMAAVPHEQRVYWIAGENSIEYSDLAISKNNITTITPDRRLYGPTRIIHDNKYETLHILDRADETLVNMHYNGSSIRNKYLDADVYDMFVYKEFMIYIGHDGNDTILKSGDIGLGSFVQWMDFGHLKNIGKVYNIKVLDLSTLQPEYPSPCRNHNGGCQHLCFPKGSQAHCDCTIGFQLASDNKSCEAPLLQRDFLVFTDNTMDEAYQVNLLPPYEIVGLSAGNIAYPWGIAFDRINKDIYWTSYYSGEIFKRNLNDSANHTLIVDIAYSTGYPLDIEIDPSTGYIFYNGETGFFTPGTHDSYISAINGKDRTESLIVKSPGSIDAFAVHVQKGLVFWADGRSGRQAIWKSTLVGTEEEILVEEDIISPDGMAIDYLGERLFWADAFLNKIFSIMFDGSDRVLFLEEEGATIKTLRIYGGYLYYSSWARPHVTKVKLSDPADKTEIQTAIGIGRIHGIDIYMPDVPSEIPLTTACAEGNQFCSHFCFPMPTGYKCACDYGYYLLSDEKTCNNAPRCPQYLGNAVVEENDSTCLRLAGNQCNFTCADGYRRNYNALLICTDEMDEDDVYKKWDHAEPCEEILCPVTIPNSDLHVNCTRSIGADCFDYTCATRYERNPDVTELVCQKNGTWAIPEPLCLEKCPVVTPEGQHAQLLDNCQRNPGDSCRVVCNEKYRLKINSTKINCVAGSGWDTDIQYVCEVTKCPDYVKNGLVNQTCSFVVDAVCNYICDDTFEGHATVTDLTCKETGQWMQSDASAVLCTSIPITPTEKAASKAVAIGVGVGVGVLVLLIIIIVLIVYMRRKGQLNYSPSAKQGKAPPNVSFENPRYANEGAGEAGGSEMGYSNLEDDKADLTQDSWRKTMSEQGTLHVYDNPTSIVQP